MSETLSQIDLTPLEIAKLPAVLRRKIEAAIGPIDKMDRAWMLVGTPPARKATLVHTLSRLPAVVEARTAAVQEHNIEKLLEIIVYDMPSAGADPELDLENAKMRAAYLADTTLLTASQVREQSGLNPRNKSEPASRWKREKKIFAVRKGGINFYPAFQFEDGQPRPVIRKILAEIADAFTPWQVAFWFESGNGWLDGEEPQDCLDQVDDVVMAAKRLAEPTIG
ncbi:MAG: hypothetical protein F4244_09735 [Gammaproteobacteria bacterium]|nr:hypothetical protein [Gammaproteobacteria bacterium]